jgi:hypothetical protein
MDTDREDGVRALVEETQIEKFSSNGHLRSSHLSDHFGVSTKIII